MKTSNLASTRKLRLSSFPNIIKHQMARPRRPKPWPIPLDPLWDDPTYMAMDLCGRGMIAALIQHYWQSGLKPLPVKTDDEGWRLCAGARAEEWEPRRKDVFAVWGRYERELRVTWAKREAWKARGREWREKALAAARAESLIRGGEERRAMLEETARPQTWGPQRVEERPADDAPMVWKD